MLINYEDQIQKIQDIRSGKIKEGLGLDIPELDKYIRFKPANFNICLGHANVGKTTVLLYLMLCYNLKHGKKWLIFSSENEPYSIIRKLIEFYNKETIHRISEKKLTKSIEHIYNNFKFISNERLYTYKDILKISGEIKSSFDFDGMFIDPYNSLVKDNKLMSEVGGHEYDYQACTEMRMFCKKLQITIWVSTHANTQALRVRHAIGHEFQGYPIPPLASDVEGGGKFVNRADDFMVIHRYTQHPNEWVYNHIHIRKVKEIETGGKPTIMDEPIKLRAIINNVGFTIKDNDVLNSINRPF